MAFLFISISPERLSFQKTNWFMHYDLNEFEKVPKTDNFEFWLSDYKVMNDY